MSNWNSVWARESEKMKSGELISGALASVFAELDEHERPIPLAGLQSWMERCPLEVEDIRRFSRFSPERYVRNLMWQSVCYQALVLCWRSGQRSPIHDHVGSACVVRVMEGRAIETVFQRAANGMIFAASSRELVPGQICASEDNDIHQLSNLQASGDLITLHLYSPPLLFMNNYSLIDAGVSRFLDPINDEFVSGAGI
jgi:cysteine dioxygenase